jgi:hypothetical protein
MERQRTARIRSFRSEVGGGLAPNPVSVFVEQVRPEAPKPGVRIHRLTCGGRLPGDRPSPALRQLGEERVLGDDPAVDFDDGFAARCDAPAGWSWLAGRGGSRLGRRRESQADSQHRLQNPERNPAPPESHTHRSSLLPAEIQNLR